jgi:hypothetical protein
MKQLHNTPADKGSRGRRFTKLVAAVPLAALTLGVFAFSGLRVHPDGRLTLPRIRAAAQATDAVLGVPSPPNPSPTAEDLELLSYRTYGG